MDYGSLIKVLACISLIIGAIECFAGFKIMDTVLVIWGVLVGSVVGVVIGVFTNNSVIGIISVLIFAIGAATLAYISYLSGIFILTLFLTGAAVYIICENILISLLIAVLVGVFSIFFVKPMVIASTSVAGAGIILASIYMLMGLGLNPNLLITALLWIPVAAAGVFCQYITTRNIGPRISGLGSLAPKEPVMSYSERKYPGLQRAYRNFCIKCGCEMTGTRGKCPRCGFNFDE